MSATKLRVIPYAEAHFRELWEAAYAAPAPATQHHLLGPAWTGVEEPTGRLVACAGIQIPHRGLGRAWALLGPLAARYTIEVTRTVRDRMWVIAADHGLRRIEAVVYARDAKNVRWAQLLHFQIEHEMPEYGPNGETAYLMVRLAHDGA